MYTGTIQLAETHKPIVHLYQERVVVLVPQLPQRNPQVTVEYALLEQGEQCRPQVVVAPLFEEAPLGQQGPAQRVGEATKRNIQVVVFVFKPSLQRREKPDRGNAMFGTALSAFILPAPMTCAASANSLAGSSSSRAFWAGAVEAIQARQVAGPSLIAATIPSAHCPTSRRGAMPAGWSAQNVEQVFQ